MCVKPLIRTHEEKKEILVGMLEIMLSEDKLHLTDAIHQLARHYGMSTLYLRKMLAGTKFERGNHCVVAIIDGEEMKTSAFIRLADFQISALIRTIIDRFDMDVYTASIVFCEALNLPQTNQVFEQIGKSLRGQIWNTFTKTKRIKNVNNIWSAAFKKYEKVIERYAKHGAPMVKQWAYFFDKAGINVNQPVV